jgi:zinc protease
MSRKIALLLFLLPLTWGIAKIKDPRTMEFPARLEFTPHQVDRFTLSNGIQVFFVEDHEIPVTDIYFLIKAGERRVPADHAGLADILANLVVNGGSHQVPKDVLQDSLDRFGASFTGSAGTEQATFKLHLLSEHVPVLLPLVVGALRAPTLPQNQLEVNKRQYLTSYQGRNDDSRSVAPRVFYKLIYGKESSQAREVTPASLENVTLEQLREFHLANYRPGHIMIGVEGDFDPDAMLDLLERCMGDWQIPQVEPWPESANYTDPAPPGVYLVHWPGSVQSSIRIGHKGLLRDDPDYAASRLFCEVYGGSWYARLRKEIRVERGLAYVVSGYISSNFEAPGVFGTVCLTKSASTLQAARLMLGIMDDLRTEGITQRELELARSSWLASFPAHYAEPDQVLRDRMEYAAHDYPIDFWDRLPDKIEPLTREDVNSFAAEFIKPRDLIIVILGDSTAFDGSLSELGEVQIIDPEVY